MLDAVSHEWANVTNFTNLDVDSSFKICPFNI